MQLSGPRLFPSKSMIDGDGSEPLYSSDRRVQVVTPSFSVLSCVLNYLGQLVPACRFQLLGRRDKSTQLDDRRWMILTPIDLKL